MTHHLDHLSIKIASLAAEARIIHSAESRFSRRLHHLVGKYPDALAPVVEGVNPHVDAFRSIERRLNSLHEHRVNKVSKEARISLLALGFLRGMSYARMEENARKPVNFEAVRKVVERFSEPDDDQRARWKKWVVEATRPLVEEG